MSSIPVWTSGGRRQLTISDYLQNVIIAHPLAFQTPTDNETFFSKIYPTFKRVNKSVSRTTGYFEKMSVEFNKIQVCLNYFLVFMRYKSRGLIFFYILLSIYFDYVLVVD